MNLYILNWFKKNFLFFLLLFMIAAIWLVFSGYWITLINRLIIDQLSLIVNKSAFNLLYGFFVFIILLYYYAVIKYELAIFSCRLKISLWLASIYFVCLLNEYWDYEVIWSNIPFITYSDIFYLPLLGEILHAGRIEYKRRKACKKNKDYLGLEFEKAIQFEKDKLAIHSIPVSILQNLINVPFNAFNAIVIVFRYIKKKRLVRLCQACIYRSKKQSKNIAKSGQDNNENYNRKQYAKSCASKLRYTFDEDQSFAIAIVGDWGSGKTSFVNMLKAEVQNIDNNINFIEFKPWFCKGSECIVEDFLVLLEDKISAFAPNISRMIRLYSNSLSDIKGTKLGTWINFTIHGLNNQDIQAQYNRIRSQLQQIKVKIVVVIDDLDRLDKEEIMEVFRLVRNSANFPYLQFIIAYDKNYVTQTISENDISKTNKYLDKIFNTEIRLPKYEDKIICDELFKRLDSYLDLSKRFKVGEIPLKEAIEIKEDSSGKYLLPFILCTNRDVIRFYNSFIIHLNSLFEDENIKEIDIIELYFLELFRYRFTDEYNLLRDRTFSLLRIEKNSSNESVFSYIPKNKDLETGKEQYDEIIKNKILERLFSGDFDKLAAKDIRHINRFFTYFAFRPDRTCITFNEMKALITSNSSEQVIIDFYLKKYKGEFQQKLSECLNYAAYNNNDTSISKLTFESIYSFIYRIISFLYSDINKKGYWIGHEESLNDDLSYETILPIRLHLKDLYLHSDAQYRSLLELFFNIIFVMDKEEQFATMRRILTRRYSDRRYLKNLFINTPYQKILAEFIERLIKEKEISKKKYVLANQDFRDILNNYLNKSLMTGYTFSENGLFVLNCCYNSFRDDDLKDAFRKARNHIKDDLTHGYLKLFLKENDCSVSPEPLWEKIFENKDSFANYIMDDLLPETEDLIKARNFWRLYEKNDYNEIEFSNNDSMENAISGSFQDQINELEHYMQLNSTVNRILMQLHDRCDALTLNIYLNALNKLNMEHDMQLKIKFNLATKEKLDLTKGKIQLMILDKTKGLYT